MKETSCLQWIQPFPGSSINLATASTLFGAPGMALEDAQNRFNLKLNKHRVAIVVPEGCHVEGENTEISFGREIYTFFVSPEIKLHTRRK